jgi:outer membrane autotransporter protein
MYGQSEFDSKKGFDMDTQGLAVGFDGHISPDTRLGVAYAHTTADGTAVQRDTEVTSHTISVYGEYNPSRFYANWLGVYTRSAYEENKEVFSHNVKAEYDVDTLSAQFMMGSKLGPYVIGNWASGVISPEAGLRYTYIKQHGYTDDAGQKVGAADGQILTGILGAQYTIGYTLAPGLAWYPELRAAVTYDFIQPDMENSVILVNGARYDVVTENLDKFGIEIGARVGLDINRKTEVAVEYEGLFKGDYTNHTGLATLKYKF